MIGLPLRSVLRETWPVRKQYNFRPGANGLDAWDVDKLIEASSDLPVREVRVDSIADVDTDFWFKFGPTQRSGGSSTRFG